MTFFEQKFNAKKLTELLSNEAYSVNFCICSGDCLK